MKAVVLKLLCAQSPLGTAILLRTQTLLRGLEELGMGPVGLQ